MSEQEKKNCPEYQAGKAAAEWLQSLSEEQRKQMDIVDAFAYGVLHGWNNPNWIPVEKELPKENGKTQQSISVWATDGLTSGEFRYNFDTKTWTNVWGDPFDITHWMPLPTPPQGKEDNGFVAMQSGKPA